MNPLGLAVSFGYYSTFHLGSVDLWQAAQVIILENGWLFNVTSGTSLNISLAGNFTSDLGR